MVVDLAGLLRALVERDIDFVVIGGIAVAAHRSVRATEDVDIVPDPRPANREALLDRLDTLGARLLLSPDRGIDADVRAAVHAGRNLTVTTELGDLDVVQQLPGVPTFERLAADAMPVELSGVRFLVCSLEHLIAMKRARASALDVADLERLEARP